MGMNGLYFLGVVAFAILVGVVWPYVKDKQAEIEHAYWAQRDAISPSLTFVESLALLGDDLDDLDRP